jgi:Protein of unknown function (DUF2281)
MTSLEDRIADLPPDLRREVEDFVDFLIARRRRERASHLRLDWAGALRGHREEYTSIELQRKALEWRGD